MAKVKSKKQPKKSQGTALWKGLLLLLVGTSLLLVVMLNASIWKSYPVEGEQQLLSIQAGDNYSAFIDRLVKNNQVSFPIFLKLYQKLMINDALKAGVYEIKQGMSIAEVMQLISNAENAQMNRILVIEGTTIHQLLARLQQDELVTKEVSHLPIDELLKALNIPYAHPEGLFAPDTYFFAKGESDRKILTDLYQRQMKTLDAAWQQRAADLPYKNKYEALIMASIVEKETNLDSELEQVSGVFVRRLKIGMRLQTDPTVIYGMGDKYQGNISKKDLQTPTAYNTYRISGLPPTPISLPSHKAIHAALHPDQSDYLYFVATGTGGHKFSRNLQEHNQAVQEYLTVIRAKKD